MKIAVLVSGGVDSSVVLAMLAREGKHEITAFYLKIWLEDELHFLGECPWEEDLRYVRACCDQLNIPLKIVPLQKEYNDRVVSYTIDELKAGRTPSPDIYCNEKIKFGAFLDFIDESFEKVATGHYASTYIENGKAYLLQGVDAIKDQSYFLSHLSQEQLQRCLFPLGVLQKSEVRVLANTLNLPTKDRPDSQGICFLGKIKYNEFVKFHLGERVGEIRNFETNEKLGTHNGFWFHTFGQRKGLRLHGGPWFVVEKDTQQNIVYVSHQDLLERFSRNRYFATDTRWISGEPELSGIKVKLRHGPRKIDCQVTKLSENRYEVVLNEFDSGIAQGQFSVFYKNNTCLGSGTIKMAPNPLPQQIMEEST